MQIKILFLVCVFVLSVNLAYAKTIEALHSACVSGDNAACSDIHDICVGGNGEGCYSMGRLHEIGNGGYPKNLTKAAEFFQKACNGEYVSGCHSSGLLYSTGFGGVTVDRSKAAGLFQKACDGNIFMACVSLAYMYENGKGVAINKVRAHELCQKVFDNDPGDTDCKKITETK